MLEVDQTALRFDPEDSISRRKTCWHSLGKEEPDQLALCRDYLLPHHDPYPGTLQFECAVDRVVIG
jgi:hypothetical protein